MHQLKVNQQQSILTLHGLGWSKRRIARELGLDRGAVGKYLAGVSKPATNPHTGSVGGCGPASLCGPWREEIGQALERGLTIQRIYQDLVTERQFTGSYYAVRRFVLRTVGASEELPFRRMECEPGQELQVDFGQGAGWWKTANAAVRICFGPF